MHQEEEIKRRYRETAAMFLREGEMQRVRSYVKDLEVQERVDEEGSTSRQAEECEQFPEAGVEIRGGDEFFGLETGKEGVGIELGFKNGFEGVGDNPWGTSIE